MTKRRGFQNLDRLRRLSIASKGGKAAHEKGKAHEWNSETASLAGKKGAEARRRNKLKRISSQRSRSVVDSKQTQESIEQQRNEPEQ